MLAGLADLPLARAEGFVRFGQLRLRRPASSPQEMGGPFDGEAAVLVVVANWGELGPKLVAAEVKSAFQDYLGGTMADPRVLTATISHAEGPRRNETRVVLHCATSQATFDCARRIRGAKIALEVEGVGPAPSDF